ncbi:MAG: hypothetical protein LW826_03025 [Candidatus Jidaibacter sp.]|jgi:hypothetical protein|nr:hypothetical protein [Candidatus Jidaibacter sp.]
MKQQDKQKHILVAEQKDAARWYDNPDMSDLMFAMLSKKDKYKNRSLCLHMYDKRSLKGISNIELDAENKWKPTELVTTLQDKILYHPILTVSTTDPQRIKCMFDNILDGIDFVNGDNGTPACIIIPVLMHYNHFGTVVIKPNQNKQETEIYYFDPLGTLADYADEERQIFGYLNQRYGINDKSIVHNSKEHWQTDGNQCGPYSIWFVQEIADLVLENRLNRNAIEERFKQIWKWGDEKGKETALKVRAKHARSLQGFNTNFTIPLFLSFKKAVLDNAEWHENIDELRFENANPYIIHKRAAGKKLEIEREELRDVAGIDAFEAQEETQALLLEAAKTMPSIHAKPSKDEQQHPISQSHTSYQVALVLACTAAGALAGYITNQSVDISLLNQMASCVTQSDTTAALIKNSITATIVGIILLAGYEASFGRALD